MEKNFQKRKFKDPNSRITSDDIDAIVDIETANLYLIELGASITDAERQIGLAKGKAASTGEFMETEKYQKLISFRRVVGFLHQKTIFKIRELNADTPKQSEPKMTLSRIFMELCRKELSADQFNSIYETALSLKIRNEQDESDKSCL